MKKIMILVFLGLSTLGMALASGSDAMNAGPRRHGGRPRDGNPSYSVPEPQTLLLLGGGLVGLALYAKRKRVK